MPIISLGRVVVAVPGSPIRLTSNRPNPADVQVHALLVQPHPANAGKIYIGNKANFVKNGDGQVAWLPAPTASSAPAFSETVSFAPNAVQCAEFWIDADNGGEGVIASGVIL
jgi:hypothetical protein